MRTLLWVLLSITRPPVSPEAVPSFRAPGSRAVWDPCGTKVTQEAKQSRGPEWPGGHWEEIDVL